MTHREHAVGVILSAVVALHRAIAAERRTPFEGRDLTPNQLGLLFLLASRPDGVTPGAAAAALGVTPGAVTQPLDALRSDLVESVPYPDDGRSRRLLLTGPARRHVREVEHGVVRRLSPVSDDLDDADLDTLARLLARTNVSAFPGRSERRLTGPPATTFRRFVEDPAAIRGAGPGKHLRSGL